MVCPKCHGEGRVFDFEYIETCPKCNGTGEYIPTPAELAQQLADTLGETITVYQEPLDLSWHFTTAGVQYDSGEDCKENDSDVIDGWWNFYGNGQCFKLNRPISYTGRWQDSKVTATPNHIADTRKMVDQSGDTTNIVGKRE